MMGEGGVKNGQKNSDVFMDGPLASKERSNQKNKGTLLY